MTLAAENEIHGIAEKLRYARDIYVLGRSIHYPIALEGALKIKELSYIHAEGIARRIETWTIGVNRHK